MSLSYNTQYNSIPIQLKTCTFLYIHTVNLYNKNINRTVTVIKLQYTLKYHYNTIENLYISVHSNSKFL